MGCRMLAGKVYVRDLSVADQPLLHIGNAQLSVAITEETQELPDYTNPAGGNACSVRDIKAVELTLTLYDFKDANLALACFGSAEAVSASTVTDEAVDAFTDGALNPLANIPTAGSVVITSDPAGTTFTESTCFTVVPGGFIVVDDSALDTYILTGSGTPKHKGVLVDYSYAAQGLVEALVTSGKTFEVRVDGKNRADGAKGEVWNFHQCQFGPVGGLNVITREFGSYELRAEVIADTSKPEGESQYFTVQSIT